MNVVGRSVAIIALSIVALAGSDAAKISPTQKYAWAENAGWLNFRPAGGGATVHVADGYMSGYVWAENLGWIKLGAGAGPYGNTSASEWGVNFDSSGRCSGYAWSENVGWINFGPARGGVSLDLATGEFSGYAWGENIGWIRMRGQSPDFGVAFVPSGGANPPSIACPCPLGFIVGATKSELIVGSDADGDIETLTASALPLGASFSAVPSGRNINGILTWRPSPGQEGLYAVSFTARDTEGRETVRKSRLYVGPAGDALNPITGLPESMQNYTPITNIAARATGATTVQWDCVAGQVYDLYYSDSPAISPYMNWVFLVELLAASDALQYVDASAASAGCVRHYQVVLSGESPDTNGIYTVNRCQRAAQIFQMMAPPLVIDRSFTGELGRVLAQALTGSPVGDGDKIHVLQPDMTFRTLWLDSAGNWRELSDNSVSSFVLSPGAGFFVERANAQAFTPVFDGKIGNRGTNALPIHTGYNIIGASEGSILTIKEAFASAQPQGGPSPETADQIFFLNADGSWTHLMYVAGWGSPYDGNWIDLNTFAITTRRMEPGGAVYYLRKGSDTTLRF